MIGTNQVVDERNDESEVSLIVTRVELSMGWPTQGLYQFRGPPKRRDFKFLAAFLTLRDFAGCFFWVTIMLRDMHEMKEDGRGKDERSLPFAAEWTIELGVVGVNVLLVVGNVGPATRALKI